MEIREKRLYRVDGWDTFEEYCAERWGWSRGRAYQLMDAAGLVAEMSTRVDTPVQKFEQPLGDAEGEPDYKSVTNVWA